MKIYTVTVVFNDSDYESWTQSFSDQEVALDFFEKIATLVEKYEIPARVDFDSSALDDSDAWLDYFKKNFCEEE